MILSPLASLALLYVGPDQIMPLASAAAAVGGVLMVFWRQTKGAVRRFLGLFTRR
jgi:hypothetical protein